MKTSKKLFFLAGLPRSGSTLLGALLDQHPDVHVSGTSGILGMTKNVRDYWPKIDEFKALGAQLSETRRVATMRGMLSGFYEDIHKPIVIDKCRQWPAHLEMAKALLQDEPKVICTVRDVRDVLASFERKWREAKVDTQVSQEEANPIDYMTLEGRCRLLCGVNQVVGSAVAMIRDAVARGWRKNMLFVEYESLCSKPLEQLQRIYDFLGLSGAVCDPEKVSTKPKECDEVYGWKNLHQIRGVVAAQEPQWPIYLTPEVAATYEREALFWRSL